MTALRRKVEVPLPLLILLILVTVIAVVLAVVNAGGDDDLQGTLLQASIGGNDVVNGVNARRSTALAINGSLQTAAQNYANALAASGSAGDMNSYLSQTGYSYSSYWFATAYSPSDLSGADLANNVWGAYGQLLDVSFTEAGGGVASGNGSNYYVVMLAIPLNKTGGGNPGGGGSPSTPPQEGRADAMLAQVNALRASVGACALTINEQLTQAALAHSRDMAGVAGNAPFLSHTGSNGSTVGTRVAAAGYAATALGENVLLRYDVSDQGAFEQWRNSPGHYSNMVNTWFKEVGIAYVGPAADGAYYYAMVLGSSGAGC